MTSKTSVIWIVLNLFVLALSCGTGSADEMSNHKAVPCIAALLHQCGTMPPCSDCTVPPCIEFRHRKPPQDYMRCAPALVPCGRSTMIHPLERYRDCVPPCPEYKVKPCGNFRVKPLAGTNVLYENYGMRESTQPENTLLAQNKNQNAGKATLAQPHDPNPQKDPDVQRGYDEHQRQHGREPKAAESSYDVHTSSGSANSGSNGGGNDTPPSKGSAVPRYAPDERRPTVLRPAPGPIPHQ